MQTLSRHSHGHVCYPRIELHIVFFWVYDGNLELMVHQFQSYDYVADCRVELRSSEMTSFDILQSIVGYYVVIAVSVLHIQRLLDETVWFETV